MALFSSGDGYEPSSLVEGYDWGKVGGGTILDVSYKSTFLFPVTLTS